MPKSSQDNKKEHPKNPSQPDLRAKQAKKDAGGEARLYEEIEEKNPARAKNPGKLHDV